MPSKIRVIQLLLLIFSSQHVLTAQDKTPEPFYKTYNWEKSPQLSKITEQEAKEPEIVLKDNKIIEYAYEKSGELIYYITRHHLVKVNNDKGVEGNNRIYIPMYGVLDFIDLQARSISKTGKITTVDKSAIKDVDDLEGNGPFKIVALEGIETGSEVEYLYTYKKSAYFFGTEKIQSENTKKNVSVSIISPDNLVFEAKVYNSNQQVEKDSTLKERNKIVVNFTQVDAARDEKYAATDAALIRMEYKLSYNEAKGHARLFTWDDAASRYYEIYHGFDKKELSAAHSYLKQLKLDKLSEEEKIRKIESNLKLNFKVVDSQTEGLNQVSTILDKKYASRQGLIRLYLACLSDQNIGNEIVFTTNRLSTKFDPDFSTWNFLDDVLLYFPTIDKYIAPMSLESRLGFPPYQYLGNKALFIKEVELGGIKSGISKIKTIKTIPYDLSIHQTAVKASIAADFTETNVQIKQEYTGYTACFSQCIYNFLPETDQIKLQEANLKITGEDSKLSNIKVTNSDEADVLIKPFIMECNLSTPSILEKAGPKYLFKIGTLIGPQAEMYQETERKLDGEIYYTHGFVRNIEFTIPEGYKITNADKLNFNVKYMDNNECLAEFVSTYVLEGNTLKVKVLENYRILTYPLAKFEDFRKVINAAADFNKVSLVLEK